MLNLVICDVTNKILQGLSLFGLLNGCAVFLKKSYSRMDIWRSKCSKKKHMYNRRNEMVVKGFSIN